MNWKPRKGWLREIEDRVPRNEGGDPAFSEVDCSDEGCHMRGTVHVHGKRSLRDVFSDDQICYLVNKALYQLEYARTVHRERAAKERALLKPVKKKLKELFPGQSFDKATEEQIDQVMRVLKKEQKDQD